MKPRNPIRRRLPELVHHESHGKRRKGEKRSKRVTDHFYYEPRPIKKPPVETPNCQAAQRRRRQMEAART